MGFRILPNRPVEQKDPEPLEDREHLAFVHLLPCCVSFRTVGVVAHHLIRGRHSAGRKAGDDRIVPLHYRKHDGQWKGSVHDLGSETLFEQVNSMPRGTLDKIALFLWKKTGDVERCSAYILNKEWRE